MAHQHICRYCDELHYCSTPADECFAKYLICDDCGNTPKRFLLIAVTTFLVIFLTALFIKLVF